MLKFTLIAFSLFSTVAVAQGESPDDFPVIIDQGGFGEGQPLGGFGGHPALNQQQHQQALTHRPIVLVHGNAASATDNQWGLQILRDELIRSGYHPAEIWALSYLGANPGRAELPEPHRTNVDDLRNFIAAVQTYLGADKVDLVAHSLGAGLAKAYMLGYGKDGEYNEEREGLGNVGTFVALAAGFYGLGGFSQGEFQTGSKFETGTHRYRGLSDDTPFGSSAPDLQVGDYPHTSELDDDSLTYVSLWATYDFVDIQNPNTGRMEGADLNQGVFLGWGLQGHEAIIKSPEIVQTFLPYLNRN